MRPTEVRYGWRRYHIHQIRTKKVLHNIAKQYHYDYHFIFLVDLLCYPKYVSVQDKAPAQVEPSNVCEFTTTDNMQTPEDTST